MRNSGTPSKNRRRPPSEQYHVITSTILSFNPSHQSWHSPQRATFSAISLSRPHSIANIGSWANVRGTDISHPTRKGSNVVVEPGRLVSENFPSLRPIKQDRRDRGETHEARNQLRNDILRSQVTILRPVVTSNFGSSTLNFRVEPRHSGQRNSARRAWPRGSPVVSLAKSDASSPLQTTCQKTQSCL